jgi:hypothetical protein
LSASKERDTTKPFDPGEPLEVCPLCQHVGTFEEHIEHYKAIEIMRESELFVNEISAIMNKLRRRD